MNETGLDLYPHYLDVGSLAEDPVDYLGMDSSVIVLGDLKEVLTPRQIIELSTDTSQNVDRPNQYNVLQCVQNAEGEIDTYAVKRYNIPMRTVSGNVPREIKNIALFLFKYYMYARRSNIPADVVRLYEQKLLWLRDLSKGLASIANLNVASDGSTENQRGAYSSVGEVYRPTSPFGRRTDGGRSSSGGFNSY